MTTEKLIKALREKPSRDNRALLDEAADQLELAVDTIIALTEECRKLEADVESLKEEDKIKAQRIHNQRVLIRGQQNKMQRLRQARNNSRATTVKEFAERLKKRYREDEDVDIAVATYKQIDNLVKEFTEGE